MNAPQLNKPADTPGLAELIGEDIAPVMNNKRLWPKDLINIIDMALAELADVEISFQDQRKLIEALLISLAFKSGGRGLYLPQANRLKTAIRNHWIYKDSKHLSVQELARKYDLSINAVYGAIKGQEKS